MNKDLIEYIIFKMFEIPLSLVPQKLVYVSAIILGNFVYYLIPIRKKVVIENLQKAFPEKELSEIKSIARKSYISVAITLFETFSISRLSREDILSKAIIHNIEVLNRAIEAGNGAILLTAHFGNWEFGAVVTGLSIDCELNVLTKQQRNKYVSKWFDEMRSSHGVKVTNLGIKIKELFRTLKNGNVIGIVGDQRGPREVSKVKLFNIPTSIYSGTAAIALKTNVPLIMVVAQRTDSGNYEIRCEEIDYSKLTGTKEEKILGINQKYMDLLEQKIRETPEQWFWMHNIWKY